MKSFKKLPIIAVLSVAGVALLVATQLTSCSKSSSGGNGIIVDYDISKDMNADEYVAANATYEPSPVDALVYDGGDYTESKNILNSYFFVDAANKESSFALAYYSIKTQVDSISFDTYNILTNNSESGFGAKGQNKSTGELSLIYIQYPVGQWLNEQYTLNYYDMTVYFKMHSTTDPSEAFEFTWNNGFKAIKDYYFTGGSDHFTIDFGVTESPMGNQFDIPTSYCPSFTPAENAYPE